ECPVRRLCPRGEGGFLMDDPPAIERLVAEVVRAVRLPVTVHIRSGRSPDRVTAVEVAQRASGVGAAAVHVHARSTVQAYQGDADWSVIERVKQAVSVPVIGSGSVRDAADAV